MMNGIRYSALIRFAAALLLLATTSCVGTRERSRREPDPHLDSLVPSETVAGIAFQTQPSGEAALVARGSNIRPKSRLRFNGRALESQVSPGQISAIVPRELYAREGMFPVSVETADGAVSNSLPFYVLGTSGPPPVIGKLYPSEFEAGKPFNVQPDGQSAMGITGERFLPGAVIEIDGEAQVTAYSGSTQLSALVPPKVIAKPGRHKVVVRNPDGKRSAAAELVLK
jgi:hypothetical protein